MAYELMAVSPELPIEENVSLIRKFSSENTCGVSVITTSDNVARNCKKLLAVSPDMSEPEGLLNSEDHDAPAMPPDVAAVLTAKVTSPCANKSSCQYNLLKSVALISNIGDVHVPLVSGRSMIEVVGVYPLIVTAAKAESLIVSVQANSIYGSVSSPKYPMSSAVPASKSSWSRIIMFSGLDVCAKIFPSVPLEPE